MIFWWIVQKIFSCFQWFFLFCRNPPQIQLKRMSIALDMRCKSVSVMMPLVKMFSNWIGVGPWMWPISCGHCKGAHHLFRWWNLSQFQTLEHMTWQCRWFCCWIELMYWVLVEDYLGVWVCLKGRSNHHLYINLWIHWDKRRLSESISTFGLNDIGFWN